MTGIPLYLLSTFKYLYGFLTRVEAKHLWLAWAPSHLSQALSTGICDVHVPYISSVVLVCSWIATPGSVCSCMYIQTWNNCITHQLNPWVMQKQSLKHWKFILHWHGSSSKKTSQNTLKSSAWSVVTSYCTFAAVTLTKGTEIM
jgi:hypothetical protein